MTTTRKAYLLLLLLLPFATVAKAQSGLNARQFSKFWQVESESPDYRVTFQGDTCELLAPKGLTLWRRQQLQADCAVEYDVQVMQQTADDRLSDMNCFWMASDPAASDIWKRAKWRSGIFDRCYSLQMYYLGYGGNHNTTTRFRRYTADEQAIGDESLRPAILREYTDAAHLLQPNHWYHVRLQTAGGRTQMWIDGECIVSYLDPDPLTSGWFGFRTTLSRCRIANFRTEAIRQPSLLTGISLHWIGADQAQADTVPVTFGIPFEQGEVKDVSLLALSDGTPSDAWINATWPDGTVKWAAMAAVAPSGTDLQVVKAGKQKQPQAGMQVTETSSQLVIATQQLQAYIPKQGSAIIDSLVIDGRRVVSTTHLLATTANDNQSYTGHITSARLERKGQVATVVRLDGEHCSSSRQWLPFTVRLYFYQGSPQVKLVHTFIYDGDSCSLAPGLGCGSDFISSLGIRFNIPMRLENYNRHIAFATDNGGVWTESVQPLEGRRPLFTRNAQQRQMEGLRVAAYDEMSPSDRQLIDNWASWDGFRLSQLTDNSFAIRKRATSRSPWIGTFTGQRAPGYAFVGDALGGLGIAMNDFWRSYPSSIQVDKARNNEAELTMYMWSPDAEPMNLCHYDTIAHDLTASYEDVQEGLSTPYGIGRTTTLWLLPQSSCPNRAAVSHQARRLDDEPHLLPTPEYLHQKRAFGIWSLPTDTASAVERRLAQYIDYYREAVEQHKWYGFWNYGDFMHSYDIRRHEWRYDVGGFAWDNTELGTPMWLWYSFLRTGRADIWRMAEAMTRHNAEVDTYHIGPLAPLGSRHNVSHWGCGAKEARISQSAFLRFYYYLTADERTGELMHQQTDCDTLLYHLDPMRLAEPREKYPCTAPARLRFGPDWLAYAGNWMTEWERTGNLRYCDKILSGLNSVSNFSDGLFTGNLALGYDPATGVISYEGDPNRKSTNHLATIMGGFEVMNELLPLLPSAEKQWPGLAAKFSNTWLDYAQRYKQMSRGSFPVRRLLAYSAWQKRSPQLTAEAWRDLWGRIEHTSAPAFHIDHIEPPQVPAPIDYWWGISTNDAALWSLDAIYMIETLQDTTF